MKDFYKNKTVLVTGHTGFKGSWLTRWLNLMGAKVIGVSLDIPTSPSNFEVSDLAGDVNDIRFDLRDLQAVKKTLNDYQPEIVFHLAAQALVKFSYENPVETMTTNAIGTLNVLEALREYSGNITAVMITSDKAYDNVEWERGYRETDSIGGKDIYSASKGMAELAIKGYFESYFRDKDNIRIGISRAGNVIGGGDWANDRIVPDCMRSWSEGREVEIRNPAATRPWQHVLEPLSGYLALGYALSQETALHGEAFNFGPPSTQDHSVSDLINEMAIHWDNISWKDISAKKQEFHEAGLLKLNCDKALAFLQWKPTLNFKQTVEMTVSWYKNYYQNNNTSMKEFGSSQIDLYCKLAREQDIRWTND
jgi:CDP-glucose 4,6-dehydratase